MAGVYSNTAANAYAEKIKAVYEALAEIRKVADRLTPVEDLTAFQAQIEALHDHLSLLVEASNTILSMSQVGEAILTGSLASIKALLEIGVIPDNLVTVEQLDAVLEGLLASIENDLGPLANRVTQTEIVAEQLDQYRIAQQAQIAGLVIEYENLATGQASQQANISSILSRLTVQEGQMILVDESIDSISQNMTNALNGLTATNNIVSGHAASIASLNNSITVNANAVSQLSSDLVNTNTNVAANTSALNGLSTTITGIGNDIVAQSQEVTELKSAIGGSGNLLANSDFLLGGSGWRIILAEDDWASTTLTVNTFSMPPEVNCLEVLGQPAPNGQIVVESPPMLVEEDSHYIISGYPCVDNGTITLSYKVFDAAGNVLDQAACPPTFNTTTNTNFNAYARTWKALATTAGATTLRLYMTVAGDGDFITQGALFRPMVEKAWAEQEGPSAWTPNTTGILEALATAIQTLETEVSDINGDLSAMSAAQTALTARVGTTEAALINEIVTSANKDAAHTASINNLSARMVTAENDIIASSSAISSLSTAVTTVQGTVSSHAANLISLQAQVDALDVDSGGSGAAISALNTRVTAAEGTIASHSAAITSLQSSVTNANKIFAQDDPPSTSGRIAGDLWIDTNDGNKVYTFSTGTNNWVLRQDLNNSKVFVQTSAPSGAKTNDLWFDSDDNFRTYRWTGSAWQEITDPRTTANATAITNLTTRVTSVEGVNDAQAASITSLQATTDSLTSGQSATASALSTLTVRVTNAENVNTAQASSLVTLNTTVGSHSATISSHATSIGGLFGKVGVDIDVNGYMVGWSLNNNGASGAMKVRADAFMMENPGAANGLEIKGGYVRTWRAASQTIMGAGFGPDTLNFWAGPNVGASGATKANGTMWVDSAGNAGFHGLITMSLLSGSAMMLGSTRISTGGGRLAPFTIRDMAYQARTSGSQSMTQTLTGFVGPDHDTGYNAKRFAVHKMDVYLSVHVSGDYGNETCVLEVSYNGGASWTGIASQMMNCNYRGGFPMLVRYTTLDTWSTVQFRARTTQGRTQALSFLVEVHNYNESGNAAGSSSGTNTGGGSGGGSPPPGSGGGGLPWEPGFPNEILK